MKITLTDTEIVFDGGNRADMQHETDVQGQRKSLCKVEVKVWTRKR